jgi:MarR family 2-MHQ and catechol resistance regulon transcriptional repressor
MSFQLEDDHAISLKTFDVLSNAYKTLMDRTIKDMKQTALSHRRGMNYST